MAKKKALINIRGASASGKTTVVRQFCERRGFSVKNVKTPFIEFPVSIINGGKICVLGDYAKNTNCVGLDLLHGKNGKLNIIDLIIEVDNIYNPDVIIYERLISSGSAKGTVETAEVASAFGYDYFGVQLSLSEKKRWDNLMARSGGKARTRTFNQTNGKRIDRATELLRQAGLSVITVDVENWNKDEMWRIAEDAIDEAFK